jgi:hypothetical protein
MNSLPYPSQAKALIAVVAVCLAVSAALAQNPAPEKTDAATAPAGSDNAWLAKAAALYYSSAKAGLTGFDCSVHPDWHHLFVTADKGQTVAEDDPRIALLKTVKITMHARMKGNSVLDWATEANPGKPLDDTSTALLDGMHQSVQQTLEGFLQFWIPFMDRSVVPDSAENLEISHTAAANTIHAKQGGTDLTEVFSNELLLQQFNVDLNGTSIKFSPAYKPTPQGLLVNGFVARILPAGTPPEKVQVMNVGIEYQSLDGLVIPSQLHMEVVGTGTFDFVFDGCATNPK